MTDLAVVTQDPRFGGGALAQTEAFLDGAEALGRTPHVLHPSFLPLADSLNQLARSTAIARAVRAARSAWVVSATASYGLGARRSGRRYGAWIGTSLDAEWNARRRGLDPLRRLSLAANAPLLRRIERAVLSGATRLYATSPYSRTALAGASGLSEDAIGVLPIPVDTERFAPEPDEPWLRRLERPTVVFVGRADDPRKNVGLLLQAWPAVRAAQPTARLRLIGSPPTAPLPAGAETVGNVASVADELRTASLLVLPSLQEGFGIVVAEALASGVPVVVTPSGGPEELVRRSGGGVVLDDLTPATMADAVTGLLGDADLALAARERGRRYVELHHAAAVFRRELTIALAELDA